MRKHICLPGHQGAAAQQSRWAVLLLKLCLQAVCWPQWCQLELSVARLLLTRVELACPCISVEHTRGPTPRFPREKKWSRSTAGVPCLREEGLYMQTRLFLKKAELISGSVLETSPQCCMDVGTCQHLDNSSSDTSAVHSLAGNTHSRQHKREYIFFT